MNWYLTNKGDRRVMPLVDRHYSRQSVGNPQWLGPGHSIVLIVPNENYSSAVAVFAMMRSIRDDGFDCWYNSHFRNESNIKSSVLIREAIAIVRHKWGTAPRHGVLTFVDPNKVQGVKVRGRLVQGFSYMKAGFVQNPLPSSYRGYLRWHLGKRSTDAILPAAPLVEFVRPRMHLNNMQLSMFA